ncbi:MAG: HesB/IscA family protein, partial [Methylohalobius sp.]
MAVTLTEKAARQVRKHLSARGKGIGIRLAVKSSGCSGLVYALEFVDELRPEDKTFESFGVTVV